MSEQERKFNKEFNALIKQLQETLSAKDKYLKNPVKVYLRKYKRIYDKTLPSEHFDYFLSVYERNRTGVLNGLKSDNWLQQGHDNKGIVIQFGEGIPDIAKDKRIMLSVIYRKACDLRDEAEARLEGLPDDACQEEFDLIRAEAIQLHLYRIFHLLCDDVKDKDKLRDIVEDLEDNLGVVETTKVENNAAPNMAGLGSIFNIATEALGKAGIKPPDGTSPPNAQDINKVLGTVFNNPDTTNTISGIFSKPSGCQAIGEALSTVVTELNSPQVKEAIAGSIQNTGQAAIQDVNQNNAQTSGSSGSTDDSICSPSDAQ